MRTNDLKDRTFRSSDPPVKIAISTGGGDAPGLNAVIRAAVLTAHDRGWETVGIRRGFHGLLDGSGVVPLGAAEVSGITHLGGTILGSTNRGNPLRWPKLQPDGRVVEIDRGDELIAAFRREGIDALISIGGDGSLAIAGTLWERGLQVVGVPKTIDNDVVGTDTTFGFDTAVSTATEALDKLHTTAESHDRVMVVELMGREAGWIALHSGISGTADVILIPEIPFSLEKVCEKIRERERHGRHFSIVVVAEGAQTVDGGPVFRERRSAGTVDRLGGIGEQVAHGIAQVTGKETRSLVLGHLQRGGSPTTFDRLLALRFGSAAVRAIADGDFGTMVAYTPPVISRVPIADVVGRMKTVPLDSGIILTARHLGISFGD
ncbi:MAG: ATP-dependent 6-phosphofructokinase [Gemmatimonadetes bacterium]|nr:ATP-dependent 6-phosphofructokinase [Gemmatimonadota bacterium]